MLSVDGKIEGIDTSQYQDNFDTTRRPELAKAVELGAKFALYRSSFGRSEDPLFNWYFQSGKEILSSGMYHYMDYYSHTWLGLNSTQWGRAQADKIIEISKRIGNRDLPVFIDVESASIAPKINTVWGTAMTILDNILATCDDYFGRATGVYASTGWLSSFYNYQKWRPLWAANYNPIVPDRVRKLVADAGWTNLYIWQFASHGDIDGDGYGDGKKMGMETTSLDLNLWMQNEKSFNEFFNVREDKPIGSKKTIISKPVRRRQSFQVV